MKKNQYVVMSNNGDWDHTLTGCVGVVSNFDEFCEFVNGIETSRSCAIFPNRNPSPQRIEQIINENELNLLFTGKIKSYIRVEEDGCFDTLYFMIKCEEQ